MNAYTKTSDFNFELPEELIARYPLQNRSESRLLSVDAAGYIQHKIFSDLPTLLTPNDVLIFNNTRVIPARLFAKKPTGGKVEILIERSLPHNFAYAQIKSNKSLKLPCTVRLSNQVEVTLVEFSNGLYKIQFHTQKLIKEILQEVGTLPLPSYLQRNAEAIDQDRYQTVYAEREGAVAAPTAGLHFDVPLLNKLREQGIRFGFITLHVGAGTFKPVRVEQIAEHPMHHETVEIASEVCELVNHCRASQGRVIAVGTTSVRALETAMQDKPYLSPYAGDTNIFIYPGYRFRCIDALITNFHLPKSTLLMLVCAFGGYEAVMNAYQVAIDQHYRFYSYGDCMFLSHRQINAV